jgi:hypothetical protein
VLRKSVAPNEVCASIAPVRKPLPSGHEADAQFLQDRQDLFLRLPPPQGILALQGRDRLHRVRSADALDAGLGETEVLDLALADEVLHGARHVFHRNLRVHAVLIEQIDAIRAQALQRLIGHPPDAFGAAVQALAGVSVAKAELGRDHDLVAHRFQRFPDHAFVDEGPVGFCRVEEGDPAFEGGADEFDRVGGIDRGPIAVAQTHAAEPEGGDLQTTVAELSMLHVLVPLSLTDDLNFRQPGRE